MKINNHNQYKIKKEIGLNILFKNHLKNIINNITKLSQKPT